MSYQKNYPNGWQSGEAGGTPITPVALDNIENGIANALPKDGTDPMTADLPMGGHRVTGLGEPVADGDAVPRGYANGHFAPAGYGLGLENGLYLNDCNDAVAFGLFMIGWQTANNPLNTYGALLVLPHNATEKCQILSSSYNKSILIRYETGGEWDEEWEWVNPPMIPGVEYRTTKRHEGKPIYTMAINLGALPNSAEASVPINVANIQYMLSATGRMSNSNTIPYKNLITISADAFEVYITATADFSYATGVAILEYTKTTD